MHTNDSLFPSELEAKIVRAIEEAVGNDIEEDIQRSGLIGTQNSVPSRIWDLINRNLLRMIDAQECTVVPARTGPWQMLVLFEKSTQNILTIMREKRFADVRRYQHRRHKMHYLDMLSKQFNADLQADCSQISFFPPTFSNEERLPELVQNLLRDLGGEVEVVQNHVLILFDTIGNQLVHVRTVKITPGLDIAQGCEWDWSQYISGSTSAVVEKVAYTDAPENRPNRGLNFTGKALARKKHKLQPKSGEQGQSKLS